MTKLSRKLDECVQTQFLLKLSVKRPRRKQITMKVSKISYIFEDYSKSYTNQPIDEDACYFSTDDTLED